MPEGFSAAQPGALAICGHRYKDGRFALRWDRAYRSALTVSAPIGFQPYKENTVNQARDTFAVWVYNEKPVNDKLVFRFGRGASTDCFFEFQLAFQGWRTAWVMFERDMQGTPRPDMDTLTIEGPRTEDPGSLYFDQMVLSVPVDPRHPTRDEQVPQVNMRADRGANNHWLSLYRFSRMRPKRTEAALSDSPSAEAILHKYEDWLWSRRSKKDAQQQWASLLEQFATFRIASDEGRRSGRPVLLVHGQEVFPVHCKPELTALTDAVNVKSYTEWLLNAAYAYRMAESERLRAGIGEAFIQALEHWHDQGWAAGSALGTVHHLGYNLQSLYPAVLLMREMLAQNAPASLKRAQQAMYWYSGAGRIHMDPQEVEGNIDIFNTTLAGMLASILLMERGAEQAEELQAFSRWLSQSLRPALGLRAAIKSDGSMYHHVNHYPAYAAGGLNGVTPVVYMLSGTPYRIAEDAHAALRKALLSMRLYCHKYEWLVSLSARHPTGKGSLPLLPFKYMALSGMPDGSDALDRETAAAYLRLLPRGAEEETRLRLEQAGIRPESDPSGHWSMNYAALGLHRRDGWLAGVRGHSRYLWANETYVDCNLYGRYIAYGHLQIMAGGEPVNHADSGYAPEGWDWNRWPGTTTVHLPWEELCADVRNVDTWSGFEEMLLSDETYCGSLHLENRNGMFAMKLHGHPKYDGSQRARKSFFFFDDRIVAIGTGIENTSAYPTQTTLFQNRLAHSDDPIWIQVDSQADGADDTEHSRKHAAADNQGRGADHAADPSVIALFPYAATWQGYSAIGLIDNQGHGYYIPAGQTVSVSRRKQLSKHQKDRSDTEGDFASAWFEHGTAPQSGEYEYAILVRTHAEAMRRFAERMTDDGTAPYSVLQKDRIAHVVRDRESATTAYAMFEAGRTAATGWLEQTDTPCMVMIRETGDGGLIVSAVDPDLRLYEGMEADQYDEYGVQREVSVYSRPWVHADSRLHRVTLVLRGAWALADPSRDTRASVCGRDGERTLLALDCKDAAPIEIVLVSAADRHQ